MSTLLEWIVGAVLTALFLFFLFQCPHFLHYIRCEDVPVYARNYDTCF